MATDEHAQALETYLYKHIPISQAMGLTAISASPQRVCLSAPLEPNINHKSTVFGGSLQAVSTLACWSLLYLNLKDMARPAEIVITSSTIDYIKPVTGRFEAEASLPDATRWAQFIKIFERRGRARVRLSAHILQDADIAVDYSGSFAALHTDAA